ncbi:transcriptional regulator protein [Escherichia coli DEC4E]|nr:transcriptional regulator protein [Escherichia coli DEC4E]
MIYIINDEVRFNSSSNKLTSLLTSEEVILTYPAGKCLKLLLDNAYSVVSHNQFFEKVWSDSSADVATNTLYQNISMIRRSFREISSATIFNDVIRTVPRKGFKINEEISITVLDNNHNENESVESEENGTHTENINKNTHCKRYIYHKEYITYSCFFCGMGDSVYIFYFFDMAFQSKSHTIKKIDAFSNYAQHPTQEGCSYFYDNKYFNSVDMLSPIIEKLQKMEINCKIHPYIYIATNDSMSGFYAFTCSQMLNSESPNNCNSLYYKAE